eukprot:TRINITY_DN24546_c0_g1_i3.p1 TRINITY_DN24546_c0_g1~~TRINITY_DN24546_c0_g1_i3.p1  ORF type:complete len:253 (-),score=49.13 TRINITY_DN24546_c0_g1_i3:141-899(-)
MSELTRRSKCFSQEFSPTFVFASLLTGVVGSGMAGCDSRLAGLSWIALRQNIIGYRRALDNVRIWQENRMFNKVQEFEDEHGVLAAMPHYLELMQTELVKEADAPYFWELFNEADRRGELLLDEPELEILLQKLDTNATQADLDRYLDEIDLGVTRLSFAAFFDWYGQARSIRDSLIAQKGAQFLATMKAQATKKRLSSYFAESIVYTKWRQMEQRGKLLDLKHAYVTTISEFRRFRMERDLRLAELECAKP